MAAFRGVVIGARSDVSRLGTRASGITTLAQTEAGQIRVSVWRRSDGQNAYCVQVEDNPTFSCGLRTAELASGTLEGHRPGTLDTDH